MRGTTQQNHTCKLFRLVGFGLVSSGLRWFALVWARLSSSAWAVFVLSCLRESVMSRAFVCSCACVLVWSCVRRGCVFARLCRWDVNLGCVGFEPLRLLVWLFCLFVCMSVCVRSCGDIIVCSRLF